MTTTATHNGHDPTPARVLCVAFARREQTWKLGCPTGRGHKPRARTVTARPPEPGLNDIAQATRRVGLPDPAPGVRGAAAGRAGCWRHRFVQAQGLTTPVVEASARAVNRWRRRATSAGVAGRPWRRLWRREAQGARQGGQVVTAPAVEAEEQRHRPRDLDTLQHARARTTTRRQDRRSRQGLRVPRLTPWPAPLAAFRRWEGSPVPPGLRRRVRRVSAPPTVRRAPMAAGDAARRAQLPASPDARSDTVRPWRRLTGMGSPGAWGVGRALVGGRAGQPRRAVGGVAGGTPPPAHRGARARAPGSTTAGNRHVRWLTTAGAGRGRREPPARARRVWCRVRCGSGGPRVRRLGMVAVARTGRLARWRVRATGVVPAGAGRTAGDTRWRGRVTPRRWGWGRRPGAGPGRPRTPSERGGRLRQACPRASQDAERRG